MRPMLPILALLSLTFVLVFRISAESFGLGLPLSEATKVQRDLFGFGRQRFLQSETSRSGLGPAYNGTSCASCHNQPAIGGIGNAAAIRISTEHEIGNRLLPTVPDLVHLFSIGDHSCQPRIPQATNNLSRRIPTPLFGAGLIEAIPDSVIRTWEDPEDRNADGIRGHAALINDPISNTLRVGRFGWKAHQVTLLGFAGEAFRNEMGITNDVYPNETGTGLSAQQLAKCDQVPDPEDKRDPTTGLRAIDQVTDFIRFLAPTPSIPLNEDTQRGSQIFSRIGCAACHVPTLLTGSSEIAALDHKLVNAYSDFLLHDIGTGDEIEQGAAKGNQFRTSPLWGLRYRKMLMHDGGALSPTEAIHLHRNESDRSRQAFERLGEPEKSAILEFLASI